MSFEEEKQLEETYVMHTFGRKPVELVSGQGMIAKDDKGNEYLDFIAGIGVNSLGHCHPALSDALAKQASRLIHVSNYYYIENRGELARDLSELLNETVPQDQREPWQTFFANSGAEANECAIKLARLHARRKALEAGSDRIPRTIVTLQRSFHGRTLATLAATAQPAKQEAFQPLPDGFVAVPANDIQAIEALFEQMGNEICAVLLEPIQGESGVHPCTAEFLQAVRRLTKQHGALMMLDEVQCGMFPLRHVRIRLPAFRHRSRRRHYGEGHCGRRSYGRLRRSCKHRLRVRAWRPRIDLRWIEPCDHRRENRYRHG